jgi:(p)ppGpp synthase/HD superfamily hydrolase
MATLQRALEIAVEAHKNQKQKDGTPYALHPIRLSLSLTTEEQKIVALLHDVVEDTEWTFEDLEREGFSGTIMAALRLLTHNDGSPYDEYVERLASNPLARAIKMADLTDNMDFKRIPEPTEKDFARFQKYHRAWKRLQDEAQKSG